MKYEDVQIGDLPQYLHDELIACVSHHAVCFVRSDGPGNPFRQCGSGTLVKFEDQFGILTAAHVVHAIGELNPWFIPLPNGRHKQFAPDDVEFLCTDSPTNEEDGPDIGFVRLSQYDASTLGSFLSFVDLANHRQRFAELGELQRNDGVWVEVGFPQELGSWTRDEGARTVTTGIYCLSAIGGVDEVIERDGFDYYDGTVEYDSQFDIPSTFVGMSGAGLWQVRLKIEGGKYGIRDRFFSGVVFYEIAEGSKVVKIRSHGRKSVYEYAISEQILRK